MTNTPPVATLRDGAISAKIWRNYNKDGNPYYSTTIQRVYTNAKGNPAETGSFSASDLLKIRELASEAYRAISLNREADREQARQQQSAPQAPQQDQPDQHGAPYGYAENAQSLQQQRDQALEQSPPKQQQSYDRAPIPERG